VLTWTGSTGATSYSVYRGTSAGGESGTAIVTGVTAATYTDTGLSNGTKYYYVVEAVNGGGSSGPSSEANATPEPPSPLAPTNLNGAAGNTMVVLTWIASSGATSYSVYRGTSAGSESGTPIVTGVTGATYTDTGLTNGVKYYYTVKAVNGGGSSGPSNEANATPEPPAPAAPTGLTAKLVPGAVKLSWQPSAGATSYTIYSASTLKGVFSLVITGVTTTNYTDLASRKGAVYEVFAVNGVGPSSAATVVAVGGPQCFDNRPDRSDSVCILTSASLRPLVQKVWSSGRSGQARE